MTKDEALKMAIEWAEGWYGYSPSKDALLKACRKALEQPAQEPVGNWESKCKCDFRTKLVGDGCRYCNTEEYIDKLHADYDYLLEENEQLLTHPYQWQGLTDDDVKNIEEVLGVSKVIIIAIEQALKDKNT